MQAGTAHFETYNRVLRRVMWGEFIDEQLKVARERRFRASLVEESLPPTNSLVACMDMIRNHQDQRG